MQAVKTIIMAKEIGFNKVTNQVAVNPSGPALEQRSKNIMDFKVPTCRTRKVRKLTCWVYYCIC